MTDSELVAQLQAGAFHSGSGEAVLSRLGWWRFYRRIGAAVWSARCDAKAGRLDSEHWAAASFRILRAVQETDCRVQIDGLANLDSVPGPVVIIGNHMSTLETLLLPGLLLNRKDICFVLKAGLLRYPVFGTVLKHTQSIAVGRSNPRNDLVTVLNDGCARLERGRSVVVFPQSTRAAGFNPAAFTTIGVKLARRAKVPAIPLALKTDFWENGRWVKDIGPLHPERTIHIDFGAPLQISGSGKSTHQQIIAFISERLRQWGAPVTSPAAS